MEEKICELCITILEEYDKADDIMEIAEVADYAANTMEEIMRLVAERDTELAVRVDSYLSNRS